MPNFEEWLREDGPKEGFKYTFHNYSKGVDENGKLLSQEQIEYLEKGNTDHIARKIFIHDQTGCTNCSYCRPS